MSDQAMEADQRKLEDIGAFDELKDKPPAEPLPELTEADLNDSPPPNGQGPDPVFGLPAGYVGPATVSGFDANGSPMSEEIVIEPPLTTAEMDAAMEQDRRDEELYTGQAPSVFDTISSEPVSTIIGDFGQVFHDDQLAHLRACLPEANPEFERLIGQFKELRNFAMGG